MPTSLTISRLKQAIQQDAAIRRNTRLQPGGGPGDKIFPPTYEGGKYALEDRVVDGVRVPCVLLDSVQSQANRIELALLEATRLNRISLPLVVVDFAAAGLPEVGEISSLEAPHRLADAILRDSLLDGVSFRESEVGKVLDTATVSNATDLFGLCPTALILGLWDSAGPKGGSGTKFQRALVSEIIGIDVEAGVRPSSRLDPLEIRADAGPLYETPNGDWTLDKEQAKKEKKQSKKVGKDGKPSEANHGNVTPSLTTNNVPNHGGVTCAYARHSTVISLPALRRLRFPRTDGAFVEERDLNARVALAALALAGTVLSTDNGIDLRSRCLLVPEEQASTDMEIVTAHGAVESFAISADDACKLVQEAIVLAREVGLPWRTEALRLMPKPQFVELVQRSRANAVANEAEG